MRCVRRANSSIALGVGFSGRFYSNFFTIYIYYFIALVAFITLVTLARKLVFGRKGVRAITSIRAFYAAFASLRQPPSATVSHQN
jgi:hypothetical protein